MIKEFYQTVINYEKEKMEVIDINAFLKYPAEIYMVLSGRDVAGKSTTMLQFIRERYMKYNEKSIIIFNNKDKIRSVSGKFLSANRAIYEDMWDGVVFTAKGLHDKSDKKQPFCHFATINNYLDFKEGGRDPKIKWVFYDEFNRPLQGLRVNQLTALENILMSANKNIKLFLFGNRVTMDMPIFSQLDIALEKDKEVYYKTFKKELGRFFIPQQFSLLIYKPEKDSDITSIKDHKEITFTPPLPEGNSHRPRDWRHMFSYQLGLYGQSIANTEDADDSSQIITPFQAEEYYQYPFDRPAYMTFLTYRCQVFYHPQKDIFFLATLKMGEGIPNNKINLVFYDLKMKPSNYQIYASRDIRHNWSRLYRAKRVIFKDMSIKNEFKVLMKFEK